MTTGSEQDMESMEFAKEQRINAPIDVVFETILEQLGPMNRTPNGPMPMKLEAWPGGRWFRDLGEGNGHFWGVVQAVKAPSLLELSGPLFMSTPVHSNIQYRLSEQDGVTTLSFLHRAMGWILPVHRQVESGWGELVARIGTAAEAKAGGK